MLLKNSFNSNEIEQLVKKTSHKKVEGEIKDGSHPLMLAETIEKANLIDPTGWIMSEKLDGVRCFWNGS